MQYSAVLEVHPNREVRVGITAQKTRRRAGADTALDLDCQRYHEALARLRLIDIWEKHGGYAEIVPDKVLGHKVRHIVKYTKYQAAEDRSRTLDIINAFQSRSLKALKPIRHQFGSLQRRSLLRSGAVLSKMYPEPGQTYEVTLTLPGSTQRAMKCLADNTPWVMNRMMQTIRNENRRLAKFGLVMSHFYVWEWQRRGALHLHMALGCADTLAVKRTAHALEGVWFDLLFELEEMFGIDMFERSGFGDVLSWRDRPDKWQSHALPIQKSLAAYFAKYAGKDKDTKLEKGACKYYPKTWWGRSRDVARAEKEQTIVMRISYLTETEAVQWVSELHEHMQSLNPIKEYYYDFQKLSDDGQRALFFGQRWIAYYDDESFEAAKGVLSSVAATMLACARNNEWSGQIPQAVAALAGSKLDANFALA